MNVFTPPRPAPPRPTPPAPREIWREFHWAFFVNVQGLILCMRRFALLLERDDLAGAETELDAAATLLDAAGASMSLAASFTREDYEKDVRVSMAPPNVRTEGFSGLLSWEHAELVRAWRDLRPRFADLPEPLVPAHARFAAAYRKMADGHVAVCARFVGDGAASLRYDDRSALAMLRRYGAGRHALIAPPGAGKGGV